MSEIDEKESGLVAQKNAVEEYLGFLLDHDFDELSSAERAADNIAGLLSPVSDDVTDEQVEAVMIESVVEDNVDTESGIEPALFTEKNDVQDKSFEIPQAESLTPAAVPAMLAGSGKRKNQQETNTLHETAPINTVEGDDSAAIVFDYRDSSHDPDVIADAEKMLSFVFPQPAGPENSPLRKLQDAGVIKISPAPEDVIEPVVNDSVNNENANASVQLVPSYASDRFTMMAFRVNGLKVLVSVTELRNVKRVEGEVQSIEGKPEWLYQVQKPEGGTGFIVDGGQLFSHDGRSSGALDNVEERYIVWLLNGQLGLLCDEVQEMVDLNKRQVSWRGSRSQREWCAGTIRSMKAILLDADSLWTMIDDLFE